MDPFVAMLLITTLAGAAMPAGAILASVEGFRPRWLEQEVRHTVIAFGGGALLAAVALVLVPEGASALPVAWALGFFLAGGAAFMGLDRLLERRGGSIAQFIAMIADALPESLALGAAFARGEPSGVLLAALIALQNVPEGFNSYRELRHVAQRPARLIVLGFCAAAAISPIAGVAGFVLLRDRPDIVGAIMLVSAGGILYLTFEDIAPQAKLRHGHLPAMGAVLGFALGMLGQMLVGA